MAIRPRCVLFDFDGVIADTENHNADYLAAALREFGYEMSEADRRALIGVGGSQFIRMLIRNAKLDITEEQLQAVRDRRGNYYENGQELVSEPGVSATLHQLRGEGILTGLVSSTRTRLVVTALNRLRLADCFDAIVCGDMVAQLKPNPECYHKAMALLDIGCKDCLIVEDSPVGIQAAINAGAAVAAYTGASIRQNVSAADYRFNCFDGFWDLPPFHNNAAT